MLSQNLEGYVTQFAPHGAPKLITCCKLTFDKMVAALRVGGWLRFGREFGRDRNLPKCQF